MKCGKCNKNMKDAPKVYRLVGLMGYYCRDCAYKIKAILGLKIQSVINLPYYTD